MAPPTAPVMLCKTLTDRHVYLVGIHGLDPSKKIFFVKCNPNEMEAKERTRPLQRRARPKIIVINSEIAA